MQDTHMYGQEPAAKRSKLGTDTEYFLEQRLVGWLIGKGGNTLQEIEQSFKVQIKVDQSSKASGYSRVQISGGPQELAQAIEHIESSLSRAAGADGASTGSFLLDNPPTQYSDGYEELQVKQRYVGWLLGKSGGVVREIEQASGCKVCINQDTSSQGYSIVQLHGPRSQRQQAIQKIEESIERAKAAGQGKVTEESVEIEQRWVGWLLGKSGGLVRAIEQESGANVTIDQSTKALGFSTVRMTGSGDQLDLARERIYASLEKAGAKPLPGNKSGKGSISQVQIQVAQNWIGWLLGKGGGAVKEIEAATGAKISVNQDTKAQGFSVVDLCGLPDQIALAYDMMGQWIRKKTDDPSAMSPLPGWLRTGKSQGSQKKGPVGGGGRSRRGDGSEDLSDAVLTLASTLVENLGSEALSQTLPALQGALDSKPELASALHGLASPSAGQRYQALENNVQALELQVDQQWIGWLLGGRGKTIREIEAATGAKIKIDQSTKDYGYSIVAISGDSVAAKNALKRVKASLAVVSGEKQDGAQHSQDLGGELDGQEDALEVEQRLVGWLVGKSGVVLKEIEAQSGAKVSIDQSTKHLGYSTVKIQGGWQPRSTAKQLIQSKIEQALG
eukprot:TRINITY_DN46734_c0_g1_i1.p1 TRINITY_DN46734_c0_g1~~TRINITY_DN46734_c0_g1_i1.p1  ORF type:complete len:616 (-),score=123.76 TRINITY_DN46734_c0_g1_i1:75-1922(-)